MSEAVKMHLTNNPGAGVAISIEGVNVPAFFVDLVKRLFPSVDTVVDDGDDEDVVNVEDTDWFKEMEARRTPAKTLRVMRTAAGLTQKELADRLGMAKSNLCALEKGSRPISELMASKIAKALGTSMEMFL